MSIVVIIFKKMVGKKAAAEKVRAIITRNRARDIYDMAFLIKNKGASFDKVLVNEKLKYYGLTFSEKLFAEKLKEKKEYYEAELKPLVFGKLPQFSEIEKSTLSFIR